MANNCNVTFEPENQRLVIEVVDATTGVRNSAYGRVSIDLRHLVSVPAGGLDIYLREWDVCVNEGGVTTQKKAMFLSSQAY